MADDAVRETKIVIRLRLEVASLCSELRLPKLSSGNVKAQGTCRWRLPGKRWLPARPSRRRGRSPRAFQAAPGGVLTITEDFGSQGSRLEIAFLLQPLLLRHPCTCLQGSCSHAGQAAPTEQTASTLRPRAQFLEQPSVRFSLGFNAQRLRSFSSKSALATRMLNSDDVAF